MLAPKRDFNRVDIPGLPDDDAERRVFGLIDREAAKALKYIVDNGKLPTGTAMRNLIYFVVVLAAHNPYIRDILIKIETEFHKQRLRSLVASREIYESLLEQVNLTSKEVPYEVMKQFVEEIKTEFPHGYHMGHELKAIQETHFSLIFKNAMVHNNC